MYRPDKGYSYEYYLQAKASPFAITQDFYNLIDDVNLRNLTETNRIDFDHILNDAADKSEVHKFIYVR